MDKKIVPKHSELEVKMMLNDYGQHILREFKKELATGGELKILTGDIFYDKHLKRKYSTKLSSC